MKDKFKLFDLLGFVIGLLTGLAVSIAAGNLWIGLGVGVAIGLLIGPVYTDKKRREKIKQLYLITLFLVAILLIFGAVALTLSAI